ncbi:MAG: hemerythrin domain-containing protein [Acidimicrobiales bacterium]
MSSELIMLIDQLEIEHVDVRRALAMLGSAVEEGDATALQGALAAGAEALGTALDVHSGAEDERLFPRIAPMIGEGMVSAFAEEHVRIRALRDQVYESSAQGGADFGGCTELCELLLDHMEREDRALFPAARSALDD